MQRQCRGVGGGWQRFGGVEAKQPGSGCKKPGRATSRESAPRTRAIAFLSDSDLCRHMAATTFVEKMNIRDDHRRPQHVNSMVFRVTVCIYVYIRLRFEWLEHA
jgi:hypothetical protein